MEYFNNLASVTDFSSFVYVAVSVSLRLCVACSSSSSFMRGRPMRNLERSTSFLHTCKKLVDLSKFRIGHVTTRG